MDIESNRGNSALSVRQMFGGDLTIVIPDMQRDYCWGVQRDDVLLDKVSVYLLSILHLYLTRQPATLGLLYGYEYPKGSNQIMIIDGQQRLTTMYLLIGMLYRRTPRKDLRRLLMSDYKLIDDREPRLLYQVRSEAMFFMSDLVINFFLDRNGRLSELEKSSWYCASYDSDPTVRSFIAAIRSIDKAIEDVCRHTSLDFDDFADFVVDSLVFYYHDIGSRAEAEDMFITINTTGEPLTLPQNLKSMLMAFADEHNVLIDRFEEIQSWAWRNRPHTESSQPYTSDVRFEQLIRIYDIFSGSDRVNNFNPANFDKLYSFFLAYRTLTDFMPHLLEYSPYVPQEMFVVVPAVAFIMKFSIEDDGTALHDFVSYLTNLMRYQRVSLSGGDIRSALFLVDKMPSPKISSLLDIRANIPEKVFPAEEKNKLNLLREYSGRERKVRKILEKAERHPLLIGNVSKVIHWCRNKHTGQVDILRFAGYVESVYSIWGNEIDRNPRLDTLRIALLALRHPAYPIIRRGDTNMSLCWHDYDWQRLMSLAPGLIRQLIDTVIVGGRTPKDVMCDMADKFADRSYPYYFLIKTPGLVGQCGRRALMRPCRPFLGYYIREKNTRTDDVDTRWFVDQKMLMWDRDIFSDIRTYGSRCLFTDCREYNMAINLYYTPDLPSKYRVEIFSRPEVSASNRKPFDLSVILDRSHLRFSFDKKNQRFYIVVADSKSAVSIFNHLISSIIEVFR